MLRSARGGGGPHGRVTGGRRRPGWLAAPGAPGGRRGGPATHQRPHGPPRLHSVGAARPPASPNGAGGSRAAHPAKSSCMRATSSSAAPASASSGWLLSSATSCCSACTCERGRGGGGGGRRGGGFAGGAFARAGVLRGAAGGRRDVEGMWGSGARHARVVWRRGRPRRSTQRLRSPSPDAPLPRAARPSTRVTRVHEVPTAPPGRAGAKGPMGRRPAASHPRSGAHLFKPRVHGPLRRPRGYVVGFRN
jgi:hypothetical protein